MWFLTRGSGTIALVLLTGSVVLGVADVARLRSSRWPRFVVDDLHRTLSLAGLLLVVVHVVTSVLDTFAPVAVLDGLIPFVGKYRPLWLGLGTFAFDLMLVVAATSLLRKRMGARAWRAVHWLGWACWPTSLIHAFGTGSDVKRGWMLAVGLACAIAVALAVLVRLWFVTRPYRTPARAAGAGALVAAGLALAAWLPGGPLGSGWARRSGTPAALLAPAAFTTTAAAPAGRASGARRAAPTATERGFIAAARGGEHEGVTARGTALVHIALRAGSPARHIDIRIQGVPAPGGGVRMQRSQVTLGPRQDPARYVGRITSLAGNTIEARLTPLHGRSIVLRALLHLDATARSARGRVEVRPL
jgi:hypothetical protein